MNGRASAGARGAILDVAAISGQGIACAPRQGHRPWAMADGSLEAIKWAALVLMVFDHVNKYLYAEKLPVIFQLGRIVMPMFGFVLAYNLARPDALARGVHGRMMYRLTLMGLAASPMCIILNGMFVTASAWWPLNILFMLLLVVSLTYLIDRGGAKCYALATALFILGGAFVNGNAWGLAAIPIVLMAGRVALRLPRRTWVFYAFYPAHLLLLLFVRLQWF